MSKYQILVWIFFAEAAIAFFLIVLIALHRLRFFTVHRISSRRKKRLADHFFECMEKKRFFDEKSYPGKHRWQKELLEVLEEFNDRFQGDEWEAVKRPAALLHLLPKARKWARSFFWIERNQAARSFALCPVIEDEPVILRLMEDKKFLVRRKSAVAAVALESRDGIRKTLIAIQNEPGLSRIFYRDALIRATHSAAEKMIAAGSEPALRQACLDVLSGKSWAIPIPFLKDDLQSQNIMIRRLAIRVLIRNPLPDCIDRLIGALTDSDEEIRIMAAKGLQIYSPLADPDCLIKALFDSSWFVRIEAARALKALGAKGNELLKNQTDPLAAGAAKYIGDFG